MRVLVTGAIGFVGVNIVRWLAEAGDEVIALYRSEPGQDALDFLEPVQDQITLVPGDVEDAAGLSAIVGQHRPDGIIHAAAMTPGFEIERAMPTRVMNINFMGTMRALDAAREHGVPRFVFVSSNGLYGGIEDPDAPVTEDTPARGSGLYAIAKIASEAICRRYKALYGLDTASGRVCSTYGPMERPTRSRQGMSAVCEMAQALLDGRTLKVRGLGVARSWTHVADIAEELIALLKAPHRSFDAYNISYGVAYTLQEVLDEFQKVEPTFRYEVVGEGEDADVSYSVDNQRGPMDIARLRGDTGYQPRFDLEAGLANYMTWVHAVNG